MDRDVREVTSADRGVREVKKFPKLRDVISERPLTCVILPVKSYDSTVRTADVIETHRPIMKPRAEQTRVRGPERQTGDGRVRPGQDISSTQFLTRVP